MTRGPIYIPNKFLDTWAWNSENFWNKIERGLPNDCWIWTGSTGPNGPLFGAKRQDKNGEYQPRMTQARRILYYETTGNYLPNRSAVYHSCRNSNCMNPDHLTTTRPAPITRLRDLPAPRDEYTIEYEPTIGAN